MTEEQAIELGQSSLWKMVKEELQGSVNGFLQELKVAEKDEVEYWQTKISAYEEIMGLPDNVKSREEYFG